MHAGNSCVHVILEVLFDCAMCYEAVVLISERGQGVELNSVPMCNKKKNQSQCINTGQTL